MDGLTSLLSDYQSEIKIVGGAIIALVAVAIIAFKLTKAILAARKSQMNDIGKEIIGIAIIVLIALAGIGGIITLVDQIAPDDSILPQEGTPLSMSLPQQELTANITAA